jgi:hypothetical protein
VISLSLFLVVIASPSGRGNPCLSFFLAVIARRFSQRPTWQSSQDRCERCPCFSWIAALGLVPPRNDKVSGVGGWQRECVRNRKPERSQLRYRSTPFTFPSHCEPFRAWQSMPFTFTSLSLRGGSRRGRRGNPVRIVVGAARGSAGLPRRSRSSQ